jgi:hypothetical protein
MEKDVLQILLAFLISLVAYLIVGLVIGTFALAFNFLSSF